MLSIWAQIGPETTVSSDIICRCIPCCQTDTQVEGVDIAVSVLYLKNQADSVSNVQVLNLRRDGINGEVCTAFTV